MYACVCVCSDWLINVSSSTYFHFPWHISLHFVHSFVSWGKLLQNIKALPWESAFWRTQTVTSANFQLLQNTNSVSSLCIHLKVHFHQYLKAQWSKREKIQECTLCNESKYNFLNYVFVWVCTFICMDVCDYDLILWFYMFFFCCCYIMIESA